MNHDQPFFWDKKIGKILDFFWGHVHNGLHASELLVPVHTPSELCPFAGVIRSS